MRVKLKSQILWSRCRDIPNSGKLDHHVPLLIVEHHHLLLLPELKLLNRKKLSLSRWRRPWKMDPHLGPETPPVFPPLLIAGEPVAPELLPLVLQLLPLLLGGLHHLTEHHELLLC